MNPEDVVVHLITLSGGEVIGKTRLQKEAYLLDQCGAGFALPFIYHHYGPYSFELAEGWEDAQAEDRIEIKERPGRYGVYSIFKLNESGGTSDSLGSLSADEVQAHLDKMTTASDVVLELAATLVFLREEGYGEQAIEELKIRKPLKANAQRIDKARALLRELNLEQ